VPLAPTELVNEVWLRNLRRGGYQIRDRNHFYAIAARAMRLFLVDMARSAMAQSRGSGLHQVVFDEANYGHHPVTANHAEMLEFGLLLEKLEAKDPAAARVVDLHHIVGFTLEEIAENTGLTLRQVRHRWQKGSDWLKRHLKT
jgi:RNA polymerase sigma factor (TIGR02999 family)